MSTRKHRFDGPNWCLDMKPKPWYIDVFTFGFAVLWMGWTFASIQQHGPSIPLVSGAVAIALAALLMIHSPRVARVAVGRFEFDLRSGRWSDREDAEDAQDDEMPEEWEKYR